MLVQTVYLLVVALMLGWIKGLDMLPVFFWVSEGVVDDIIADISQQFY